MFEKIPNMLILGNRPCHHDADAVTMLELAGTLHARFNEIVDECNTFTQNINSIVTNFKGETAEDQEAFRTALRQEFQDFIDIVNVKLETAFNTGTVSKAMEDYIKAELAKMETEIMENVRNTAVDQNVLANAIKPLQDQHQTLGQSLDEVRQEAESANTLASTLELTLAGIENITIPELIARIEALESGSGGSGGWLFEDQYLDTNGNKELPAPSRGVSYTSFGVYNSDGKVELATSTCTESGELHLNYHGELNVVYLPGEGWFFHPMESMTTSGEISIRING